MSAAFFALPTDDPRRPGDRDAELGGVPPSLGQQLVGTMVVLAGWLHHHTAGANGMRRRNGARVVGGGLHPGSGSSHGFARTAHVSIGFGLPMSLSAPRTSATMSPTCGVRFVERLAELRLVLQVEGRRLARVVDEPVDDVVERRHDRLSEVARQQPLMLGRLAKLAPVLGGLLLAELLLGLTEQIVEAAHAATAASALLGERRKPQAVIAAGGDQLLPVVRVEEHAARVAPSSGTARAARDPRIEARARDRVDQREERVLRLDRLRVRDQPTGAEHVAHRERAGRPSCRQNR